MRHLTISTALLTSCLIAGAAWAQGSSSSSSGGSAGGASGGSSSSASPSTGSTTTQGGSAQPNGSTVRPPVQGVPGNAGQAGNSDVRGTPNTVTGNRTNQENNTTGDATMSGPVPPPGSEGSTGGPARSANQSSTGPATTGGISGVNRLQPGERSAVGPTPREEKLFQEGEQLEQKAREGICSDCGAKKP